MKIALDTTPLSTGHAVRGIGTYTRELQKGLAALAPVVELTTAADADLIHYPFFDLFFHTLPLFSHKEVVVTIHDVIPLEFPEFYSVGFKGKLAFLQQLAALHLNPHVITDSEYSKQRIIEHLHLSEDAVTVVYLAASPLLTAQTAAACEHAKKKLKLPEKYVLYVGDINYNKNIPQLIKMLKFLPDELHLVCVGSQFFPHDIIEWRQIEQQLVMSDVEKRVHFIADLPSAEQTLLSAVYTSALCLVQPSLSEGFGLPVLEAAQCLCPVVSSSGGSLPEVAGPSSLLVQPLAESFAEGVLQVQAWSEKTRKERTVIGREWAANFSWKKVAEETAAVYARILATPHANKQ